MTRTPKVAINEKNAYALGWVISQTPNGTVVWHNGGTSSLVPMSAFSLTGTWA
jgi:hypothetical protein